MLWTTLGWGEGTMNLSKDSPSGQGSGAGRAESVWAWRHRSVDGLRPWGLLLGHRALMHLVHFLVCA